MFALQKVIMGELYHVYVFGDSTFDYGKALCDLVHLNSDPLVISFFEKTYYAIRALAAPWFPTKS